MGLKPKPVGSGLTHQSISPQKCVLFQGHLPIHKNICEEFTKTGRVQIQTQSDVARSLGEGGWGENLTSSTSTCPPYFGDSLFVKHVASFKILNIN